MKRIRRITINFATVNAAFFSHGGSNRVSAETARILHSLADKIDCGQLLYSGEEIALKDYNGNTIGLAKAH